MLDRLLAALMLVLPAAAPCAAPAPPDSNAASPANAVLAAALRDAGREPLPGRAIVGEDVLLRALYARHGLRLLWSDGRGPSLQAAALADQLAAAGRYGLQPGDYAADLIYLGRRRLAAGGAPSAEAATRFDLMLSRAALRLVSDLHYGRIDPRAAGFELQKPRNNLDVVATVAALASAPDVGRALHSTEPQFYHYALLEAQLARYQALADLDLPPLPAPPRHAPHAGDAYAGAPALRRLLTALGDLPAVATPASTAPAETEFLDNALSAALARFQDRHGLTADGALGPKTFAALSTPLAHRVRQIELTLERWRWLPPIAKPPIIVNIPQFRLFAFQTIEDRVAGMLQMPVIVGQTYPRTRTPVFIGQMTYVVFRPYWDVPRSITLREMLPAIADHPDYLERNNLQIVDGQGDDAAIVQPSPAALAALAAGRMRLRQRPGEDNALGLIKFIFPNEHDVYMHSTPAHHLFAQSRRAFSHGCIRVSDPLALARFVLRQGPGQWDDRKIEAAMHGSRTQRVTLPNPIPVMILYGTAEATEAGPMLFFEDIYGHDRRLAELLAAGEHPAAPKGDEHRRVARP